MQEMKYGRVSESVRCEQGSFTIHGQIQAPFQDVLSRYSSITITYLYKCTQKSFMFQNGHLSVSGPVILYNLAETI